MEDQQDSQRSGIAAIDDALAQVAGLADRPVAEHVAVFEKAHESLRQALDAPQGA